MVMTVASAGAPRIGWGAGYDGRNWRRWDAIMYYGVGRLALFSHECISVSRCHGLDVYICLPQPAFLSTKSRATQTLGRATRAAHSYEASKLSYRRILSYISRVLQSITRAAAPAHYTITSSHKQLQYPAPAQPQLQASSLPLRKPPTPRDSTTQLETTRQLTLTPVHPTPQHYRSHGGPRPQGHPQLPRRALPAGGPDDHRLVLQPELLDRHQDEL